MSSVAAVGTSEHIRCAHEGCHRKINEFNAKPPCKCGQVFCDYHWFFQNHKCTADQFASAKNTLQGRLTKLKAPGLNHLNQFQGQKKA